MIGETGGYLAAVVFEGSMKLGGKSVIVIEIFVSPSLIVEREERRALKAEMILIGDEE
jgi:hypothetical protein